MNALLSLLRLVRPEPVASAPEPVAPPLSADPPSPEPLVTDAANTSFPDTPPPAPWVTATELWEAFRDNEAEAEHRFAHRPLYVAGAVEEVRRHGAAYALRLSVSGRFTATVSCHLSDDRRFNLRGLRPGALILVLGRRVFMQYGAVVVDDALVLEDDLAAHFRSAVS